MTVKASDIEWLRNQQETGHCGEETLERRLRNTHNARLGRIIAGLGPRPPFDTFTESERDDIAAILTRIAEEGLDEPRDLDVALDAIEAILFHNT